jgi:Uma2 family endonuclease
MNIALRKPKRLTVSEFIEMIRPYPDEERWELLDGEAVLMSPQTERHQRIVMELAALCRSVGAVEGLRRAAGARHGQ